MKRFVDKVLTLLCSWGILLALLLGFLICVSFAVNLTSSALQSRREEQTKREIKTNDAYISNFEVCMVHLRQMEHNSSEQLNRHWEGTYDDYHLLPDDYLNGHMHWTTSHIYEVRVPGQEIPKSGMTAENLSICLGMR